MAKLLSTSITGSLVVSGSADLVTIQGSGSTASTSIFAIDGNNGRLFEVSDDLSDSLFSVNTVAGLPVLEVFADNRVVAGAFNQNDFVISGSKIGIGTDAPEKEVHVSGSGAVELYVNSSGGASSYSRVGVYNEDDGAGHPGSYAYLQSNGWGEAKVQIANNYIQQAGGKMIFYSAGQVAQFSTGNVGIGTGSPTQKLTVEGNISASGAVVATSFTGSLKGDVDGNASTATTASYAIRAGSVDFANSATTATSASYASNAELLDGINGASFLRSDTADTATGVLTFTGNGSAIPLNISNANSSYTAIAIKNTGTGNSGIYYDAINGDLSGGDYGFIGQNNTGHMEYNIGTSSPAPFHYFSGGSVGIGNAKPAATLTVEGAISSSGDLYVGNDGSTGTIHFGRTAGTVAKITGNAEMSLYSDNLINFIESDASTTKIVAGLNSGTFNINTTTEYNAAIKLFVNGATRFNGDSTVTGNLTVDGIVTAQEFHTEFVSASIVYQSGSTQFGNSYDDVHTFSGSITLDGGTAGDTPKLTIAGNDSIIRLGDNHAGGPHGLQFDYGAGNSDGMSMYYRTSPEQIVFENSTGASGTAVMAISRSGAIGIGTTSPGYKLQVAGNVKFDSDVYFYNTVLNPASNFATQRGAGFKASTGKFEVASSETALELSRFSTTGPVLSIRHSGSLVSHLDTDGGAWFSGNVGIGVTAPNSLLSLETSVSTGVTTDLIAMQYNTSTVGKISSYNAGGYYQDMVFTVATASANIQLEEVMRITGNGGNVGIGTASPSAESNLSLGAKGASEGGHLTLFKGIGNSHATHLDNYSDSFRIMYGTDSNSAAVQFILKHGTGNVGIGTSNPSAKLHVSGGYATDALYVEGYVNGMAYSQTNRFALKQNTRLWFYDSNAEIYRDTSTLRVYGNNGITLNFSASQGMTVGSTAASRGILDVVTPSRDRYPGLVVSSSGWGAIGTPMAVFDGGPSGDGDILKIKGLGNRTDAKLFQVEGASGTAVLVRGDGNVGIGTSTPQRVLDVKLPNTSGNLASIAGQISVGNYQGIHFGYSEPGNNLYRKSAIVFERTDLTSNNAQGKVHILNGPQAGSGNATLADAKLTIGENGNVGIGTTSPTGKLHVSGTNNVLLLEGSGSTIFDVQGSQGQLFSVTDSLVGSLFSVNDISGLPIIEVFDTDKVVMGTFGQNTLVVTGSYVGIGTDAPNRPLMIETNTTDVLGALKIKNAGTGDASMFFTVNASGTVWQLGIDNSDGDKFKIGQDNLNADVGVGTKLTIDTSGNVGVNTTSPGYKLDVVGEGYFRSDNVSGSLIVARASNQDQKLYLRGGAGSGEAWVAAQYQMEVRSGVGGNTGYDVILSTAAGEGLRVDASNSNNVGIGTNAPDYKLDVAGEVGIDSYIRHNGDTDTYFGFNAADEFKIRLGNGDRTVMTATSTVFTTDTTSTGYLQSYGLFYHRSDIVTLNKAGNGWVTWATRDTTGADSRIDLTNIGRFTSAGNAEIGGDLTVSGIVTAQEFHTEFVSASIVYQSGSTKFGNSSDDTHIFTGNVGIGTTSPNATLHVVGGAHFGTDSGVVNPRLGQVLIETGSGASTYLQMYTYNGSVFNIQSNGETAQIGWGSGVDRTVAFTNTGAGDIKVGIGTASPTGIFNSYISATRQITHNGNGGDLSIISDNNSSPVFYVKGTGTADLVNVFDNTTEVFTILDGGNVGIGTTNPGVKLAVAGPVSGSSFIVPGGFSITQGSSSTYGKTTNWLQMDGHGIYTTTSTYTDLDSASSTYSVRGYNNDDFAVFANTGTANSSRLIYFVPNGGNVGIGTTSPSYILDINGGTARITYAGYSGYEYHNTAGTWEVYIGTENNAGNARYNSRQGDHTWYANSTATMKLTTAGYLGIGTTSPTEKLDVNGNVRVNGVLEATEKSFNIEHPTKPGKRLIYGVLEGPEHAVYVRGKSTEKVIELPEVWTGLVHQDTITVQLTCKGKPFNIWVEDVRDNKVYINTDVEEFEFYYYVQAERKDVNKLIIEKDAN